jgi:hypothetical protein
MSTQKFQRIKPKYNHLCTPSQYNSKTKMNEVLNGRQFSFTNFTYWKRITLFLN